MLEGGTSDSCYRSVVAWPRPPDSQVRKDDSPQVTGLLRVSLFTGGRVRTRFSGAPADDTRAQSPRGYALEPAPCPWGHQRQEVTQLWGLARGLGQDSSTSGSSACASKSPPNTPPSAGPLLSSPTPFEKPPFIRKVIYMNSRVE